MKTCFIIIDQQRGNRELDRLYDDIQANQTIQAAVDLVQTKWFDQVYACGFINPPQSVWQEKMHWHGLSKESSYLIDTEIQRIADQEFYHSSYFPITKELSQFLEWKNMERVLVCGMETDCCVLFGACQLFEMGYDVAVAGYACASSTGLKSHQAGLTSISHRLPKDALLMDQKEVEQWIQKEKK